MMLMTVMRIIMTRNQTLPIILHQLGPNQTPPITTQSITTKEIAEAPPGSVDWGFWACVDEDIV